jgi:hypothetical protein
MSCLQKPDERQADIPRDGQNTDEIIYHCAMCDIEIKQQVPHLSTTPLEPAASP